MIGSATLPARPAPLSGVELTWWQDMLCEQLVSGADRESVDKTYANMFVEDSIVADGGAGTLAVHRAASAVAACRISDCLHPLTLRPDLRVEGLCATPDGQDAAGELLGQVDAGLETRVEVPVHGTAAALREPLRQQGFQPEVLIIRRPTTGLPAMPSWQIRAATEHDADFIIDCLAAAVRNGLDGREPQVDIDAWVRVRFANLLGANTECVVAESGGQLVGHAYAMLRPDRYRAGFCAYVADVFVLPQAKGRGCSHALTAALGARLRERGVLTLEGEVIMTAASNPDALRVNLAGAGWREDRIRWLRQPS